MGGLDRAGHGLRVGRLRQRLGDLVAVVALVGVVAAELLEQGDDLRRLLVAEDGEFEGELVAPRLELVVGAPRV